MLISHSARSDWVIGLPSLGLCATATLVASTSAATPAANVNLRIDMLDLALGIDTPTGDGVEVMARKTADPRRLCGLAPPRHELFAGRLHVAALVPGAALQDRRSAVPSPRHAEAG